MTNTKLTRRALLSSVLALVLCFTMLLGTTFAWFTDEAVSSGNKIVAGNLDVKLLMWNGTEYENIGDNGSAIFGKDSIAQDNNAQTLWEPGKTQIAYLAIENAGNLDLKYQVTLNVSGDDKNLYEVMEYAIFANAKVSENTDDLVTEEEWDAATGLPVSLGAQIVSEESVSLEAGATHYFALAIHMQEEANNDYQGAELDFDITVFATQLNSESDSFGSDYDADVSIPVFVSSAEDLIDAVTNAEDGDVIEIIADIADTAITVDKSVTITGDKTLDNVSITAGGKDVELTVSDLNFAGSSYINANNAKKLTVSGVTTEDVAPVNGTATNSRNAFIALGSSEQNKLELVIENCDIVVPAGTSAILGWAQITKATITGNTFGSVESPIQRSSAAIADAAKFMSIADGATFTITGNTVYTNSNGFAFYQNTTRDNAYTVIVDDNDFYGSGDHIWVEIGGTTTTKATVKATSNNTVNGNTFTAADIKSSSRITTWTSYAGVDVTADADGKLTGGTITAKSNTALVAEGYTATANTDGTYTVVAE